MNLRLSHSISVEEKKYNKKIREESVLLHDLNEGPWLIGSEAEIKLKKKIEKLGKPLKEWDIKIYRGVLTGFNKAFIIDNKTKEALVAEDPKSSEIIKPILRGRDIKRYHTKWANLWLISTFPSHKLDMATIPSD